MIAEKQVPVGLYRARHGSKVSPDTQLTGCRVTLPPVIITAHVEPDDIEPFDRFREKHFPPARNFLKAHITVFHHLPGKRLEAVRERVSETMATRTSFFAAVSGLQHGSGRRVQD